MQAPFFNVLFDCYEHFEAIENNISSILDYFKEKRVPSMWLNGSKNRGEKATFIFDKYPLKHEGTATGVIYNLSLFKPQPIAIPGFSMTPVHDDASYTEWDRISADVFGYKPGLCKKFMHGLHKEIFDPTERAQNFIISLEGKPVGIASLFFHENIAGCYWAGVLEAFRKRGISTQMTLERMRIAKEQGCQHVISQCEKTSLNIYKRLGFKEDCQFDIYIYNPTE